MAMSQALDSAATARSSESRRLPAGLRRAHPEFHAPEKSPAEAHQARRPTRLRGSARADLGSLRKTPRTSCHPSSAAAHDICTSVQLSPKKCTQPPIRVNFWLFDLR